MVVMVGTAAWKCRKKEERQTRPDLVAVWAKQKLTLYLDFSGESSCTVA